MRNVHLALVLLLATAMAALAAIRPIQLAERMTAADFRRAGLHKLTDSELRALEAWINNYTAEAIQAVIEVPEPSGAAIEALMEGEFEGWNGDTVVMLDNGQVWKQIDYAFEYHYAYRPRVTIIRTRSGWFMKVDGMSKVVEVEQVR